MGRTQRKRNQRHKIFTIDTDKSSNELGELYKHLHTFNWQNHNELTARNFISTGRGLCSKSHSFVAGEELLRLPVECLITIQTLEQDEDFKALFNSLQFSKDRRIAFQSLLAFYILFQNEQNEHSKKYEYLCTLPKTFTVPYFCPLIELQCLPEVVLERTVLQNRKIRENYLQIQQIININKFDNDNFAKNYSLDAFKWAYFVVNTRSVYINSRQIDLSAKITLKDKFFKPILNDETNLALAPFLDLFNHSTEVTTSAHLLPNVNAKSCLDYVLTLESTKTAPLPCYSQLFISYGTLSNLKLLTEYGFILENNIHDFFEFSLVDIEHFLKQTPPFNNKIIHRNKFKFIREHNLHDQLFVHIEDGISHNLRVVLHLLLIEQSHFPNVLNQIAFGVETELDDMQNELNLLIQFKICEYNTYIENLKNLSNLSKSGKIALEYMLNSIHYLRNCLSIN